MSQLQKRLSPNLRLEWKLFDQEKASAIEFLSLCEKMIKVGEFLLAHDVARAGLKKFKMGLDSIPDTEVERLRAVLGEAVLHVGY